jgi:hypothetical protein
MGTLAVAAFPVFFSIYRESVFQITPRDGYAPMLQWIVGQGGAHAPMGYRILSVAAATPLYFVLPPFSFSRLGPVDPAYLKATAALTAVSFLCMVGFAGVVYHIARSQYRTSAQAAALTGVLDSCSPATRSNRPSTLSAYYSWCCCRGPLCSPSLF